MKTKRTLWLLIAIATLTGFAALSLTGCGGDDDTPHTHNWGEWTVTTAPTYTAKGVETRTCKGDASHKETRSIPQLAFTSIDAFGTWLGSQDGNDKDTPYTVVVNISDLGGSSSDSGSLGYILDANDTKYVSLDLSGSTFITLPMINNMGAFDDCSSITGIILPSTLKTIEIYAFYDCISLASVTIPNSVTSIGYDAFYRCSGLTSVTIPNSVTSIGNEAFYYCKSLTSVRFETGSNIASADFGVSAFPEGTAGNGGDSLRTAYNTGKAGTYTRAANGTTWTKQP